jgi:hypothetical protein
VIASAAVIGALTVVLATRSAAVAPGAVAGALPTAKPTEPPAAPHPAPMVAGSGVAASPSVPPPTAIAAGSAIATPASAQRPPPTVEQMRSGPAAATPAPTRIAPPRPAVSRSARPATALVAPRGEPEDPIVRAFEDRSFDKVVAACSAGPVTAEHASLCFVAACHLHDEAKARQLLTSVAGASRERLLGTCLQAGLDLAIKKPPVVDCDADPMACQR